MVSELLEAVELEHESLVKRGVSRLVGVPEPFPFGVKLNLVAALGWQCPEETVGVKVVIAWLLRPPVGARACARPHLAQPELESFPQWEALKPQPLPHGSQGGLFNQP